MPTTSIVPRVESPLSQLRAEPVHGVRADDGLSVHDERRDRPSGSSFHCERQSLTRCHAALEMGSTVVTSHAWV